MKYLLTLSLFLSISITFNAQNNDVKDAKAKAILERLSAKHKAAKTLYCTFSYRLENKDQGIDEVQKGTFKLKGNKYVILLEDYEIVSDGKTRWLFMKEVGEVQIEDATISAEAEELMNPSKIFSLHEKGFKFKYAGKKQVDGKLCQVIKLFPEKADEKPYHSITTYIDNTDMLYKAKIATKDGNKYSYTLNKVATNIDISDNTFVFDESKASDVIDLR